MNLKEETFEKLADYDKTFDDVEWVGSSQFTISKEQFLKLADVFYDDGFGAPEVAEDLLVVGKDWWLERHEYDGSEWWEFKQLPKKPKEERVVDSLIVFKTGQIGYMTLSEINKENSNENCQSNRWYPL